MKRKFLQHGRRFLSAAISGSMLLVCITAGAVSAAGTDTEKETDGLMVGVGIETITPTSDMYPTTWGSGNRGFAFIGAVEDIYVRVIAVSNDGKAASPENTSLIIGFETGKGPYPEEFIETLSSETGVLSDHVFWSTTHMHSAPEITTADWADALDMEIRTDDPANTLADLAAKNKAKWGAMVKKQMVAAAEKAINSMVPAEVSLGTTESYINVNRDTKYSNNLVQNPYDPLGDPIPGTLEGYNGEGFSDKTLSVVEFRERAGDKAPIAFIVHYAMHNTLLYANDYFNPDFNEAHGVRVAETDDIEEGVYDTENIDNTVLSTKLEMNVAYCEPYEKNYRSIAALDAAENTDGLTAANAAIHPDIGGLVSQYVEKKYPGAVALWMSGAAGDQNPVLRNTFNFESPYTDSVLEIPVDGGMLETATYYAAIQFEDVQRAIAQIEEADNFAMDTPISFAWGKSEVEPIDELYYGKDKKTGEYLEPEKYPMVPLFMTVMKLGDLTFAGVPHELYNAIGVAVRDETVCGDAPTKNTLVINHCWTHAEEDSYRSYYPDDVAISNNSYRWGKAVKYPSGVINDAFKELLSGLWQQATTAE